MIDQFARAIIGIGLLLLVVGGLMLLISRFAPSGKLLPGDIVVTRDGLTLYFPLATMRAEWRAVADCILARVGATQKIFLRSYERPQKGR